MIRITYFILISLFTHALFAQKFDFETFEVSGFQDSISNTLLNEVREKRIVLLGEQSHGDGASFDMKVMLIKQLHRRLEFNIIAFESGLYDCYKAGELAKNQQKSPINYYREAIFPLWSETSSFSELIQYVNSTRNSGNPLTIIGFDNQEGNLFKEYYFNDLKELFLQADIKLKEDVYEVIQEVFFGGSEVITSGMIDSLRFAQAIELVENAFNSCKNTLKKEVMQQSFDGYLNAIYSDIDRTNGKKIYVQNPRDEAMAKNLVFLANLYPEGKIIGWGASYHFAYDVSSYENSNITKQAIADFEVQKDHVHEKFNLDSALYNAVPMGQIAKDKLKNILYSLSFTSFDGTFKDISNGNNYDLPKVPEESIEQYLAHKSLDFAFVKMNSDQHGSFYSSMLGNLPVKASWQRSFDGVIFIRTAYPPKQVEYENEVLNTYSKLDEMSISGVTMDQKGNPIPYAHILINGTSIGTVSNDVGEFTFNFSSSYHRDTIQVSSLGFKAKLLEINAIDNEEPLGLVLEEHISNLNEVVVLAERLDPKKIVKEARNRISDNYFQESLNQKFFYRVDKKISDTTVFKEEAMIFTYLEGGFAPSSKAYNNIYGKILQFRNTTENSNKIKWDGVGSLWLVFTHDLILDKDNILHRTSAYDLVVSDIISTEDIEIYEISFECKRPNAFTTGFGYPAPKMSHGKIFVRSDNYAVLRYEHCIHRQDYSNKKRKFEYKEWSHQLIQTYAPYNDRYFLNYSKQFEAFKFYDLDKKISFDHTNNYDLLMTELTIEKPKIIRKPIDKIKEGIMPSIDPNFWNNHNFSISDKLSSIKCDGINNLKDTNK